MVGWLVGWCYLSLTISHYTPSPNLYLNPNLSTFFSVRALVLISRLALQKTNDHSHPADNKGTHKEKKQGKKQDISQEIGQGEQGLTVRFYRALYAKLLSPQVTTRAYNTLFLNLLFRAMKHDPSECRTLAFVKRLGSLPHTNNFHPWLNIIDGICLIICVAKIVFHSIISIENVHHMYNTLRYPTYPRYNT